MICADSNFIIDFLKNKDGAVSIFHRYKEDIATTEINIFEVFSGIYSLKKDITQEDSIADSFFDSIPILNSNHFGKLSAKHFIDLIKRGKEIGQNDCFIAAIMFENGCNQIITKDKEHFERIKGIKIISY